MQVPSKARLFSAGVMPVCVWLIMGVTTASAQHATYAWSLHETRNRIALYTSDAPHHSYDAVKAEATLAERPETLVSILRDIPAFPRWYGQCKQTRVLERPAAILPTRLGPAGKFLPSRGDESYVLFFLQNVPMVKDRWAILRNALHFDRDGSLTIEFHSLDHYAYRAPADAVRMHVFGTWKLTPLQPGLTRVSFMLDIDPVLSTPAFLVDPKLHDIAIDTLAGLRAMARALHAARSSAAAAQRNPPLTQAP